MATKPKIMIIIIFVFSIWLFTISRAQDTLEKKSSKSVTVEVNDGALEIIQNRDENICFYPMEEGNYWVYQGIYETMWEKDTLKWKAEVTEVIELDSIRLSIIKGFPFLLKGYTIGMKDDEKNILNEKYLIIQVGQDKYFQSGMYDEQDLNEIKNSGKEEAIRYLYLSGLLDENFPLLERPLTIDKTFSYWWVADTVKDRLEHIKGLTSSGKFIEYTVEAQESFEEDIWFNFVPGIGITSFYFSGRGHRGDVDMVEISLKGSAKE